MNNSMMDVDIDTREIIYNAITRYTNRFSAQLWHHKTKNAELNNDDKLKYAEKLSGSLADLEADIINHIRHQTTAMINCLNLTPTDSDQFLF